jgi:hypothetical protein
MRRRHKKRNIFIGMTINSFVALFIGISLTRLFANLFGELASQAIPMMAQVLLIPTITLVIGVIGWIWTAYSKWQDF